MQLRWPWVSRSAFDLLTAQVAELKAERTVLYDRLATLGLGGPLFMKDAQVEPPDEPEQEDLVDPNELKNRLRDLMRSNPRRYREERRKLQRQEIASQFKGPTTAWIPDATKVASVNAAMDAAEAKGRKQA